MKILNVAWRTLRGALGDKRNLMMMFLMPLAFSLVFGLIFGGGGGEEARLGLALYLPEADGPADALRTALIEAAALSVYEVESADQARQMVTDADVIAALLVGDGFNQQMAAGQAPQLTWIREAETNLSAALRQEVERVLSHLASATVTASLVVTDPGSADWQEVFQRAIQAWAEPPVKVVARDAIVKVETDVNQPTNLGISFLVMFVMMGQGMATGSILEERSWGTWQRLLAAPVSRAEIMLGSILGYFCCGWFQFAILLVLQRFLYGVSFGGGLGLLVLTSLLVLCSVAIGLTIGALVKTYQQQQAFSALILNVGSMLGGLFIPLEFFSPALLRVARLTPQYWAREGYVQLILRGGTDWAALRTPLLVLLGCSAVFIAIGVQGMRREG
jgi:ABC-2 type transport system permease protein